MNTNEPKPMDPADLEDLRRTIHPVTHPSFSELLADRDYQERRAVEAERECDDLARLTGSAIVLATAIAPGENVLELDEAIAGHALTCAVEQLRSEKGLAIVRAVEAERERDEARSELAREIKTAEDEAAALRAEVARLRARVPVEAEDVERAGVTWAEVDAWLLHDDQEVDLSRVHRSWGSRIDRFIAQLSRDGGVRTWDILDEMAAMPLESEP